MAEKGFWQSLDDALGHSTLAAGDSVTKSSEELLNALLALKDWAGGEIGTFDVERELRGTFAQYSNWAITDLGDRWSFIKR
jgi:hypothetical protein